MQAGAKLVDWAWLSRMPDARPRVAALSDPPANRVLPSTSFG